MLKVVIDVQATAGGDNKKELRKSCEAFLDEVMPELKGLRESSDAKMSKILDEESAKVYSIKPSKMAKGRSPVSGRKKWRRP